MRNSGFKNDGLTGYVNFIPTTFVRSVNKSCKKMKLPKLLKISPLHEKEEAFYRVFAVSIF